MLLLNFLTIWTFRIGIKVSMTVTLVLTAVPNRKTFGLVVDWLLNILVIQLLRFRSATPVRLSRWMQHWRHRKWLKHRQSSFNIGTVWFLQYIVQSHVYDIILPTLLYWHVNWIAEELDFRSVTFNFEVRNIRLCYIADTMTAVSEYHFFAKKITYFNSTWCSLPLSLLATFVFD